MLLPETGGRFEGDAHRAGSPFFKSDEAHIRVLALDRDGNLIAGSDGSGLCRISPRGIVRVVQRSYKKEITALAVRPLRQFYAAGGRRQAFPARLHLLCAGAGDSAERFIALDLPGPGPEFSADSLHQRPHQRRIRDLSHRARRLAAPYLELA